jgi:hypothetical protein
VHPATHDDFRDHGVDDTYSAGRELELRALRMFGCRGALPSHVRADA